MAELFWTKKTPTADGWYWWREDISYQAQIVSVYKRIVYRIDVIDPTEVARFGGEWYGPLVPPGGDAIENCAPPGEAGS